MIKNIWPVYHRSSMAAIYVTERRAGEDHAAGVFSLRSCWREQRNDEKRGLGEEVGFGKCSKDAMTNAARLE
ncbi:hypothetical protein NG798_08725 [Ancylothrix sp. C2]|uniref:hypothetical protein n=1 Tax=Ancylothrix sp. D3o TaxID=2953691 RepID=UPI0021BB2809|nr:hypothetical protein [Ancylothrix sp. D3o]MCT7949869.1 hypothetical protein [Ancylothrix sp. D3o]